MVQSWTVSVIKPNNYVHADAYLPVAQTVFRGFLDLGIPCQWMENSIASGFTVLFGGHLLNESAAKLVPWSTIIYNLEQYDPRQPSPWFQNPGYQHLLRSHVVWDFSRRNVEALSHSPLCPPRIQWVPLGYAEGVIAIPRQRDEDQIVDVLFYGSINQRRADCLDQLAKYGVKTKVLSGVYGSERDAWIARAKIVLNIHFYETAIFEWARVIPLLANGVPVVSEVSDPNDIDSELEQVVRFGAYDDLVEACLDLLERPEERVRMSLAGKNYVMRLKEAEILRTALSDFYGKDPGVFILN